MNLFIQSKSKSKSYKQRMCKTLSTSGLFIIIYNDLIIVNSSLLATSTTFYIPGSHVGKLNLGIFGKHLHIWSYNFRRNSVHLTSEYQIIYVKTSDDLYFIKQVMYDFYF